MWLVARPTEDIVNYDTPQPPLKNNWNTFVRQLPHPIKPRWELGLTSCSLRSLEVSLGFWRPGPEHLLGLNVERRPIYSLGHGSGKVENAITQVVEAPIDTILVLIAEEAGQQTIGPLDASLGRFLVLVLAAPELFVFQIIQGDRVIAVGFAGAEGIRCDSLGCDSLRCGDIRCGDIRCGNLWRGNIRCGNLWRGNRSMRGSSGGNVLVAGRTRRGT